MQSASRGRAIDMRCVVVVTNLPIVPVSREQALRNLVAKYVVRHAGCSTGAPPVLTSASTLSQVLSVFVVGARADGAAACGCAARDNQGVCRACGEAVGQLAIPPVLTTLCAPQDCVRGVLVGESHACIRCHVVHVTQRLEAAGEYRSGHSKPFPPCLSRDRACTLPPVRLQARRFVEHPRYATAGVAGDGSASTPGRASEAGSEARRRPAAVRASTSRAWGGDRRPPAAAADTSDAGGDADDSVGDGNPPVHDAGSSTAPSKTTASGPRTLVAPTVPRARTTT